MSASSVPLAIQVTGGPTAVLRIAGLCLVTDPTFDGPGQYESPSGAVLTKTAPAAADAAAIGPVDAVLLSHDQHADNLDHSGRAFLATAPLVLTTPSGAERLRGADTRAGLGDAVRGLEPWDTVELPLPGASGQDAPQGAQTLTITAVPARHGPEGCEPLTGEVVGFVLAGPGLPTVYVSGDNAWLGATRQVAERFGPIDTALLFAGAARTGTLDGALLTLDSAQSADAAEILGARRVVPVHYNSWKHFTEGADQLREAFERACLGDRLVLLAPGESAEL
ncbi:MBL fold metallo-hydrolase [Actinocrinis puniceicyclus]|uniref:MBL fold metallo-hydrolase n=1 Tax=Actinocrinis puniceicyclus TaxID=977794 RepID=A0A8J8BE91_9ACTN|nr:MBL fold metallo-hydrolase [Actinocrinis puniceicyclus]MBS2965275.1 MBL fold metallo-hydrolase [Actinocrinis puniceicyclus]